MKDEVRAYNDKLSADRKLICDKLAGLIDNNLKFTENKVWHAHPVWFIGGNPVVGYSSLKDSVQLMFWSGADFDEDGLQPGTGKFKDASIRYQDVTEINDSDVKRWLKKSETIQWDYKNIYKNKGVLHRLA